MIAWWVNDTAKASFEVEDYTNFLAIQSESAIRAVISTRVYDGDQHGRNSLRDALEAVGRATAYRNDPVARRAGRTGRNRSEDHASGLRGDQTVVSGRADL